MFTLIISLLVGATLGTGLSVASLLPATLCMVSGILVFDVLQSGVSLSTLQASVVATVALQIGYTATVCARYRWTTPPHGRVIASSRLAEPKKPYAEVA